MSIKRHKVKAPGDMTEQIGRTKYSFKYPEIVEWLAANGLIDKEIAKRIGISPRTMIRWKKEHPELLASLKKGKGYITGLVENSLLKNAMGYTYDEVKQIGKRIPVGGSEKVIVHQVEKTTKRIPPNVIAQIFYLKNRAPETWKDKHETEHSGEVKGGFNVTILPEEKDI